uniref:Secreted protein n=3 Tax=Canis lupus TaxID=9612 RepID=A0A8C0T8P7_CANLF
MRCLPRALPWSHCFLQWLCVWHLGSLLPVKIPALSTVLELPENSSVHYRPLLLEQRKKTMKMPLWGISVLHLEELALQLLVWCFCVFFIKCTKFDNAAGPLAIHSN